MSSDDLIFSGRVFLYFEEQLPESLHAEVIELFASKGLHVQCRDYSIAVERSKLEKPQAFISHDHRDKELVATKIAVGLTRKICPVWYDEFSLKVGDGLRESIERGLRECGKCIIVISPHFLSNEGWPKTEFNAIFTREILEKERRILPVWYGVTKKQVYEYSPALVDRVALDWRLGEDKVITELHRAILHDKDKPHHFI